MTQTRTLIIRQAPRWFVVVEQNTETMECLVVPCLGEGRYYYTHQTIRSAARESWAKRYRTIKAALTGHPEAQRAPEYDPEDYDYRKAAP